MFSILSNYYELTQKQEDKMDIHVMFEQIGVQLATLAAKGTATSVTNKIKANKDVKDAEKLRVVYDEIVNELLNERDEAVRIAQVYKDELNKVVISDADIKHLHNTISNVLEVLKALTPQMKTEQIEPLKALITSDTLKTMQLLGFNYKMAIGEPLTEICSNAIRNGLGKNLPGSKKHK